MQLCAQDSDQHLIIAENAVKQRNYFCLECQQTVRLRRGTHRQAHFYHLRPNTQCRLNAKGMPHLMLQHFLKNALPTGEAEMEHRFSAIGRIADVVWHAKQLVYEIQCSPISPEEVIARNADYASIGYRVVWIFHEDRYNQCRVSAAELVLRDSPHYFTNMNARGEGGVYDQFAIVEKGVKMQKLSRLPIDLTIPRFYDLNNSKSEKYENLPKPLRKRAESWMIHFSGDTIDCCLTGSNEALLRQIEGLPGGSNHLLLPYLIEYSKNLYKTWIAAPYRALFRLLLERACR